MHLLIQLWLLIAVALAVAEDIPEYKDCEPKQVCKNLGKATGVTPYCLPKVDKNNCPGDWYNGRCDSRKCGCCVPKKVNQCIGEGTNNSKLWKKIVSAETTITTTINEGNNVTRELEMRIIDLEMELRSKLDIILNLVNTTMAPPLTTAPPLPMTPLTTVNTTMAPPLTTAPPLPMTPLTTDSVGCSEGDGFFSLDGSNQCFKIFKDKKRTWDEAKTKCSTEGLKLARPSYAVTVMLRKHIYDTYGWDSNAWVDARADGFVYRWQNDNEPIPSSNPLWFPGQPDSYVKSSNCLLLAARVYHMTHWPTQPYHYGFCAESNYQAGIYALCESKKVLV